MSSEYPVRVEGVGYKNVRFLGYNFLQDVRYNNEPVVPRIISQGKSVFRVEELKGDDIQYLSIWNYIPTVEKFRVLYHVVGQFKEIDKAGLVLFDREGRNIMANVKCGKMSVRQVDLEEFYDKNANSVYADVPYRFDGYTWMAELFSERGFNLWAESVEFLSYEARAVMLTGHIKKNKKIFDKYYRIGHEPETNPTMARKDLLTIFQNDIARVIDSLS